MQQQRYTQPADFWQERDFGGKISAAFEFVGAHWKPLSKCLVYFVLPAALLGGIGMGLFTNRLYGFAALNSAARRAGSYGTYSPADAFSIAGLLIAILGFVLATVLLSATLYGYLRVRLHLPAGEVVQPRQVWQAVRARLGWVMLGVLLLVTGYVVAGGGLMGVFIAISKSVGLGFGTVMLGGLAWFAVGTYVSVSLSLYFPALWLEDRGIFAALGRSFQLVKGNWWNTAGLLFVSAILQSTLGFVFVIPQYVVLFGRALQIPYLGSDVLGVLTQCIYAVGIVVTYSLPLLILAFHYFSLVEQRDATGSLLLLDQLGHAPAATPTLAADYYRPDDEGEY